MRLFEFLAKGIGTDVTSGNSAYEVEISGLTADSRLVRPGFLFAALPGAAHDGRDYIGDALDRGAAAVLASPGTPAPAVPLITDANPRRCLALMAAHFFDAQPDCVAAVTGTNGKTSVVWFLRQIWERLGHRAASMGTLGITAPEITAPGIDAPGIDAPGIDAASGRTTPDPVALHETLAELARAGVDHLAMETSSHGLDQYRLDGVGIGAAAFTNLSRDHLDYHGDLRKYRAAKMRLFSDLLADDGVAVVNTDMDAQTLAALREIVSSRNLKVIEAGRRAPDIRLLGVTPRPDGQDLTLAVAGRTETLSLPFVGAFQAENLALAIGLALATGAERNDALAALDGLEGVPGRVQRVARIANGAAVYVDYAHTPDALERVLKALRAHTPARLIALMGCGGDRDPGKRPEMGAIAARDADFVIVTDDNPRGEDPAAIRFDILAACPDAREIGDRGEAIAAGVAELSAGDVLVIAGKGHETGQIVGDAVLPFDDAEAARAAVAEREGRT